MALLVYSDKCKWSQDTMTYIKTQPALLEIVRFWNVNDQGLPSKKITRVPTLVTNDGKMLVGQEVMARIANDGAAQILSQSETAVAGDSTNPGYVPDMYQSYDVIEANLDRQLRDALKANKGTPGGLIGTPRELASGASAPGPSPSY